MSWERIPIKEICTGIYDGPHATPAPSESGAIFLGISNFVNGQLDLSNIRYISESDLPKWTKRVTPQKNDIVFSYEATLNLYAIIPEGFRGCLGRRMALLRIDETRAYYKYVYYYMFSNEWRSVIQENTVLGATVDRIPLIKFPDFEIELPPIDIQHRIAGILSAYDDLIENNQKQIKLLEEAAQRLYKEWFVDLRFPGWETAEIVDGVPVGWHNGTLAEIALFKRGKTITKASVKEGNVPVVAGGLEPAYYHDEANTTAPVITVSGSGANAGFSRLYHEDVFASDCSFADSNSTPYVFFVYCFLKDNKSQLDSLQKGSAQPHVYAKDINAMKIILPPETLLSVFCTMAESYYSLIGKLQVQIRKLSEARDRLLPKLMSGELEV